MLSADNERKKIICNIHFIFSAWSSYSLLYTSGMEMKHNCGHGS